MEQEYARVKHLIETGFIKDFGDFIAQFQKKTLYKHLHMGFAAFDRRLADPGLFTINELSAMASLVGINPEILAGFALRARKKKGKR
jgi:hypothetical protein